MSWDKLCRSKEEGGMGFRDLHAHNLALLSKQGWRLVKIPSSLLGRLYKARYFPNSDFWSAPIPSSSSASWKGIFEAHDLLVNNSRWQIGDGSSVHAWEDPWLPRGRHFRPLSRRSMRLSMLTWKPKLVSRRFLKTWTPPPNGWLKTNLDGAFNPITRIGGVGVIVRDSNVVVVGGLCFRVSNGTSAEIVEAFAGRAASEMANEYGYSIVFESDCLKLVKAVSDVGDDDSSFGQVVADVKQELSSLPCLFFSHVFRESNLAADKLAKLALNLDYSLRWNGPIPQELIGDGSRAAQECNGMARESWIANNEGVMTGKDGHSVASLVAGSWPTGSFGDEDDGGGLVQF
ncbi:hypothetical protein ACLB2K_069002 [Fragaria x ananassa]